MTVTFNSTDHYWSVSTRAEQVYASKRAIFVGLEDAEYVSWLNSPTNACTAGTRPGSRSSTLTIQRQSHLFRQ